MDYTTYGNDPQPYDGLQGAVSLIASNLQRTDDRFNRHVKKIGALGADITLTADDMRSGMLEVDWALSANVVTKVPITGGTKTVFYFLNRTSGSFTVTVKTTDASSAGVTVPQGSGQWLAIDDINVIPLTPAVAVGVTSLSTGLVAYWKLDETTGSRADSIGSNTLTDNNTVTSVAGKIGNAAQFTAANSEFLSIVDNAALSTGDIDFSIAGWVYFDTLGVTRFVLGKWAAGTLEYCVQYNNGTGKLDFFVSSNGALFPSVASTPTISAGTWYFFVAWHDSVANTINLSIDNGAAASAAHSLGVFNGTSAFVMGKNESAGGNYHNGKLDEVGFWKKVLSSTERTLLYNSGAGRTTPL